MSDKLNNLGTKVDPRAFAFRNGEWYITDPRIVGRRALFSVVAPWCGYCLRLSEQVRQARQSTQMPSYYVVGDGDDLSKQLSRAMGVQGYPTIYVIERDGKLTTYEGDRSAGALSNTISGGGQSGGGGGWSSWWL